MEYKLEGNTLRIIENEATQVVDLTNLNVGHEYPIMGISEESVTVIRFYGKDERDLFES